MCTSRSKQNRNQLVFNCVVKHLPYDRPKNHNIYVPSTQPRVCKYVTWHAIDKLSAESLLEFSKKFRTDLIATVTSHSP